MKKVFILAQDETFLRNIEVSMDKKEYQLSYPSVNSNSLFTYCCNFRPDICIIHFSYVNGYYQLFDLLISSKKCFIIYITKTMEYGALYNVMQSSRFYMMSDYQLKSINDILQIMEKDTRLIDNKENEIMKLKDKLEEDRLVKKAKLLLMKVCSLSEEDAYKFILKKSMDERLSKSVAAKNILNEVEK